MTAAHTGERLTNDLKALVQDAEEFLKATTTQAEDKATELRERLATALDSAKAALEQAEEKTAAAVKVTDKTIRTHPYEAIAIALGVGLVLGLLIPRD